MTNVADRPVTFSIAHAIPGRVRFRVPRIAIDASYARRLARLADSDVHVASVRISSAGASLAVSYYHGSMAEKVDA